MLDRSPSIGSQGDKTLPIWTLCETCQHTSCTTPDCYARRPRHLALGTHPFRLKSRQTTPFQGPSLVAQPVWLCSACRQHAKHAEDRHTGVAQNGPAALCREHAGQPTSCCCAAKRSTAPCRLALHREHASQPTSCCCAAKCSTASRAAWLCTAPSARSSSSASFTSAALCCSPASRCVRSACREDWCRLAQLVPGRHMCRCSAVALRPGTMQWPAYRQATLAGCLRA